MKILLFIVLVSLPWTSFSQSNNVIALECEHAKNSRNWRKKRDTDIDWFVIRDTSNGMKELAQYSKYNLVWIISNAAFTADWIKGFGLRMPGEAFSPRPTMRCPAINRKTLELYATPSCSNLMASNKPKVVGACRIIEEEEMGKKILLLENSRMEGNKI